MDRFYRKSLFMTLISLWSAMFGGAVGAMAGRLSDHVLYNVILGFAVGLGASVTIYLGLLFGAQMLAIVILRTEFSDRPLGCSTSDRLAGFVGGLAGAFGAAVVTALPDQLSLTDPFSFVICWTAAAFVAIIGVFVLIQRDRWLS